MSFSPHLETWSSITLDILKLNVSGQEPFFIHLGELEPFQFRPLPPPLGKITGKRNSPLLFSLSSLSGTCIGQFYSSWIGLLRPCFLLFWEINFHFLNFHFQTLRQTGIIGPNSSLSFNRNVSAPCHGFLVGRSLNLAMASRLALTRWHGQRLENALFWFWWHFCHLKVACTK